MNLNKLLYRCFDREIYPLSITPLKGDASGRRYYRVLLNADETDGMLSLIVMELPENPMKADEASNGEAPAVLPFVDVGQHLAKMSIRVPQIYLDATDEGALLLEDLGDNLFLHTVEGKDPDTVRLRYEQAVKLLAKIHERMTPVPQSCIASQRLFDEKLLRWELDHYREWGIEAFFGITLDPNVRKQLDTAFDDFAKELAKLPTGFVHRDYQSRNIMVLSNESLCDRLAVIDFQDALVGPRIYDLVALLNDSYVELSSELKEHIVRTYADIRKFDFTILMQEFHLMTIQRKLKDGGRFVFIDKIKNNPSFLPFVERSFERVKTSLHCISGHERLKFALAAADPLRFS